MMKFAIAAAVAFMVTGCAHAPIKQQVNRTTKADKLVVKDTPNQAVKKRWFSGYKIKLFH